MRTVLSLLSFLLVFLFHTSEEAYLSELGNITPCIAPCTDYGIVITPRGKQNTLCMSVYKFTLRKGKELEPSDVKKIKTIPSEVPLDYNKLFGNNVSIATYIMPLVRAADKAIPRDHHLSSPIFFSITQRINALNRAAWFKILSEVNLIFANKTVPFTAGPFAVRDNCDFFEAFYKWQLMNFLDGAFSNSNKTVGVLSLNSRMESEISYEQRVVDKSVTTLSTIRGIPHAVVTSTFFKRGATYPFSQYFKAVSSPRKSVIESPCGPKGVKKQFKGLEGVKWIVGTGDVLKCRDTIRRHLLSICDKVNGCAHLKKPFKGKFVAFPDVGETMKELGYNDCVNHFTPTKLDAAIRRTCGGKHIPAKRNTRTKQKGVITRRGKNNSHIILDCIDGNFLYLMLTEAYKIKKDTNIEVKRKVAGLELDPSLGELLEKMHLL